MSEAYAPAAPARPTIVTVSSWLLYLVAALQAVGTVIALSTMGTIQRVTKEVYAGTDAEGTEGIVVAGTVGTSLFLLLIAVGLVVLGYLNGRGKNASRIVTWVVGGILLCCSGFGVVFTAAGNSMNFGSGGGANMPDAEELTRRLEEELPSWYNAANITTSLITILALLVALILLALPAANAFFRRPQATFEPPVPGYPAMPGYPSTPGYPPAPGYPAPGAPPTDLPDRPDAPPRGADGPPDRPGGSPPPA